MPKVHKLKDIHIKKENITLDINMSRIERNLNQAQRALDFAVMHSMEPFMPMQAGGGGFIGKTRGMSDALAGSGKVVAAAPPYGQFLYEGKTMVDEKTGSPYARKYARKVLVSQFGGKTNAKPDLEYSKHSNQKATAHWFEAAKEKDLDEWQKVVDREMKKR